MAENVGYRLYFDGDRNGDASTGDGISGGNETAVVFTDHDFPLGSGQVTYPNTVGTVSGVFYEYSGETYFVPDDPTGFPPYEAGTITDFVEPIEGSNSDDKLDGTSGDDVIHDTSDEDFYNWTGNDRIEAGDGDDTVVFGDGDDTIRGQDGDDNIGLWSTGGGNNLLDGGAGSDSIIGGSGNDQILGGDGNDFLSGGRGFDTIDGGAGRDEIWVTDNHEYADVTGGEGSDDWDVLGFSNWESSQGVDVNFTGNEAGKFEFAGTAAYGEFREIEHIITTDYDDTVDASASTDYMVIEGGDGNDSITGGSGDSEIYGGAGSDTLTGGAGEDKLVGGDGNDVFNIHEGDEKTDVHGEGWWDTVVFHEEGTSEGVTVTYEGDTYGTYEMGGASGSFSSIEMTQTTDNDDFVDGSASNWGVLTVNLAGDDTVIGTGGNDEVWAGDDTDSVTAGGGYDKVWGGTGDDFAAGEAGNDTLKGEDGNDTLFGGAGNDELYGGDGSDVFGFADGEGYDVIHDFVLDGTENDQLDVSGLTDENGDPVTVKDVVVGSDGYGNAVLTFPGGEGIQLNGVDPKTLDGPTLHKMGIPCFAEGTLIRTARGDVPIEALRVDDLVQTLDNGMQPIVWIGKRHLTQADLAANPKLQPVRIRQGALGNDRDLIVSPQHGMVTTRDGDGPNLARAIHLARNGGPGFRVARGIKSVTYYHLMFERHEIIIANNAPSERFYPGPMALNALASAERAEISVLFPDVLANIGGLDVYGPTARRFLHRQDLTRNVAAQFEATRAFG
ncbi:MAG: Hint domain-containing protein [Shimia sp.]|uniref:Hint domain-containing protein n=1 Tax=Shimia sp. TaxID=1954381 RepID=UPI0040591B5D